MQEDGEPGQDAQRPDTSGFQPEAGAQPPPDPPFGQVFQLLLGDPGEVQDIPALEAQAMHLPGVAGILGVPAAALSGPPVMVSSAESLPPRAVRGHAATRQIAPPNTGSAGSKTSSPARNS